MTTRRRQVYAAIAAVINASGSDGTPFTIRDIAMAMRDASTQITEDEWVDSSAGGVQRWCRVNGDDKWYLSTATTASGEQRLVELHTVGGVSAGICIFAPGGQTFGTGAPADGWRCVAMEDMVSDVSSSALAWAAIEARVSVGLP